MEARMKCSYPIMQFLLLLHHLPTFLSIPESEIYVDTKSFLTLFEKA